MNPPLSTLAKSTQVRVRLHGQRFDGDDLFRPAVLDVFEPVASAKVRFRSRLCIIGRGRRTAEERRDRRPSWEDDRSTIDKAVLELDLAHSPGQGRGGDQRWSR